MNKKTGILAAVLLIFCVTAGILFHTNKPATSAGDKEISVVVTHADKSENTFTYQTDAEYLGEVLLDEGLIAGEDGPYGLYILTVDGETVDESKQQWWCVTKGGEAVNTGADATPVADGDTFELTLTEGY